MQKNGIFAHWLGGLEKENTALEDTSIQRSFAFVSSTVGAMLISIVAAWTVSSVILDPVAPNRPSAVHLKV
jgi:hypothetical protein